MYEQIIIAKSSKKARLSNNASGVKVKIITPDTDQKSSNKKGTDT